MATTKNLVPAKQRMTDLKALLERQKASIAAILPKFLSAERILKVAMVAASRNPLLLECDQLSILRSVMVCAQLGLEPDGPLGHAYLVPFRNNRAGRMECQPQIGYRGLIALARRSGDIVSLEAHVVYEGDVFDCRFGLVPELSHVPDWNATGKRELLAVYAISHLRDGGLQYEVMTRGQVEAIKSRSRASASGPWVTDFDEMARKTVVKRLCKYLPMSVELARAVAVENAAETGDSSAIDAEFDVLPSRDGEEEEADAQQAEAAE